MLAILPGNVQKTRRLRGPKFEGLPPEASTMFEDLSVTLEQVVGSNDLRPAWWLEEGQLARAPSARRYAGQRLKTLLAWHEQYAPDEWERHRNAATYVLQGNRNPLIDFPEWALRLQFEG
ncbi:endonuclease [Mesorhizobium sp. M0643]|uniref:endonuclease n=1 Tax=Mesorhizobium sp. M0643 TaxID=2956978 RepID=UPI0033371570